MQQFRQVLAFDPGRNVGVALVAADGTLLSVRTDTLAAAVPTAVEPGTAVITGDGTGSAELLALLRKRGLDPVVVDERGTTLAARDLYWRVNPPGWPLRLLPVSLRPQPRDIDGYAAWALALRWLATRASQRMD